MAQTQQVIMTAREVAAYLRVTETTVYKLAQAGEIPAVKVGRNWRFRRDLIDEWFETPLSRKTSNESGRAFI